jgi:phosphoribosyl-ATP pyrophosphohydrolase
MSATWNPWHPMKMPRDLKTVGKLGEEAGELAAACCRCVIQGIDECEPVTGKLNRDWLAEEIADVLVNARLVAEHFGLDNDRILARIERKEGQLRGWHSEA